MSYLTDDYKKELAAFRKVADVRITEIANIPAEINDNMLVIRPWKPDAYSIGDVRAYASIPYKCVQAHDSTGNESWTPDATPALWMQYHGTSKETARPYVAPTGAHDMYHAGEWMIWTDGLAWPCIQDTIYSPEEWSEAWGAPEEI